MATLKMAEPWQDPRTGVWKLRKRIPARFRAVASQAGDVVKISTGTADRREALRRWPDVLRQWAELETEWERRLNVVTLTPETALEMAAKWAAWIAEDMGRLDVGEDAGLFASKVEDRALAQLGAHRGPREDRRAERLEAHTDEAIRVAGVSLADGSRSVLTAALRPVVEAAYRQASLRDMGVREGLGRRWNPLGTARAALPAVENAPPLVKPREPAVALRGLYEGWKAVAVVKPRTLEETRYILDQLVTFAGHDDAARIDRETLVGWRDALKADGRTNNTWNNRLSLVRQVFTFGVAEGRLKGDPTDGLRLRKNKPAPRLPYTDTEAARILNAARQEPRPSLRWAHWIMAFTGMRAGEVLQLTRGDVRQEGNVWFLAIHEDDAGKTVKSGQRRNVPIHSALIREGLLAYAETIQGDGPLFPDKAVDRHGNRGGDAWSVVGMWVRDTVGITDKLKAPDHSWRHRVEDELRAAEVPEDARDAIVGHARKTTGRLYGTRGEALRRLHSFVERLPVPAGV